MPEIIETDYETERGKPTPSLNHGSIQANLLAELLYAYRKQYRIVSEISLDLAGWSSTPDIGIFPKMKIDFQRDKTQMTEPPLGVIEIVSPSQSVQQLYEKAEKYFQHGVKSAWLIIPTFKMVAVYASPDAYQMFSEGQVEDRVLGISVAVDKIFDED